VGSVQPSSLPYNLVPHELFLYFPPNPLTIFIVTTFSIDSAIKHFTRHGQHLNLNGKELVALELAKIIDQLQTNFETIPIQIQWKEDDLYGDNLPSQNRIKELMMKKKCKKPVKLNKCQANNNMECQRLNMNTDCQNTGSKVEFVKGVPLVTVDNNRANNNMGCERLNRNTDGQNIGINVEFGNEVPSVTADNNMECLSFGETDSFHKLGNSVASVELPLMTHVGCVGEILKANDNPRAVDSVSNSTRLNDDSQEEVIARKSTRLRKLPTIRKQNFL
jgi:hypothetical protein